MTIDARGARAYVTDQKQNTLYVIDLCTGAAVGFAPTGRTPHQVAIAAGRAFVANFDDQTTTVVDITTNQPIATVMGGGLGVAANPQTQRVYLAEGPRGVTIIDALTYRRLGDLAMPANTQAWSVAIDPATNRAYVIGVTSPATNVLTFDATSGQLLRTTPLSGPARYAIAIGPPGDVIAATYTDQSSELSLIDGATGAVLARRQLTKWTMYVAYQSRTGLAYATSIDQASVMTIDVGAGATVTTTRVPDSVGGLAVNPVNGNLVVSSPGGPLPPQLPFPPVVPVVRP